MEEAEAKGFLEGKAKAAADGIVEGYAMGLEFSASYAAILYDVLNFGRKIGFSAKERRVYDQLVVLISDFIPDNVDSSCEKFDKILAKYKLLKALTSGSARK